jgi:hypothetical protein
MAPPAGVLESQHTTFTAAEMGPLRIWSRLERRFGCKTRDSYPKRSDPGSKTQILCSALSFPSTPSNPNPRSECPRFARIWACFRLSDPQSIDPAFPYRKSTPIVCKPVGISERRPGTQLSKAILPTKGWARSNRWAPRRFFLVEDRLPSLGTQRHFCNPGERMPHAPA